MERVFACHGIEIRSALPLAFAPAAVGSRARLRLRIDGDPDLGEPEGDCLRSSPHTGYRLHRDPDGSCWLARPTDRLHLSRDRIRVAPLPLDALRLEYLQTRALALWLHLVGIAPIHASAVSRDGRAVALVGRSGAGKSTLAAALVDHGYCLCADDLLPLQLEDDRVPVRSGVQRVGLWPDSARHFHSDVAGLPTVTPETDKRRIALAVPADGTAASLRAIFLLGRGDRESAIRIERLAQSQALLALLTNGQMAGPAEALGHGGTRMQVYAEVLRRVGVFRIVYPSDHAQLPRVCTAIDAIVDS